MRINIVLLGILSAISLTSCEKEDKDEFLADSSFYAMKNSSKWISTGSWANYSSHEKKFVIVGAKSDPDYYQAEQLILNIRTADISKSNTVTDFYAEWIFIVGGDAVADTYFIDSTFNNFIKISSLDTVNKQIKGNFSVKLIRDKWRSAEGEVMLFNKGHFNLNYGENN